jgi:tripartite-type tricarboxylate transporter receptor subunit TctC
MTASSENQAHPQRSYTGFGMRNILVSARSPIRSAASAMRVVGRNLWAALVLVGTLVPALAHAQAADWPSKTVTIVVPFAAGGNTDIMARLASQKLSETFKQTFIVDNRVGAGGAIASAYVAQAAPDGYTLFFAASPQIAVVPRIQKVNYDPGRDFAPVSIFGTGPFILAISGSVPAKTIPEFVDYAKSRTINYASGGIGTVSHLAGALFMSRAGLDAVHIPFRGGGPAVAAALAGQVEMYFGNASEIIPQAESGKLQVIGVAADKRMKQLPDVPTVGEIYPGFALSSWNGFLVPAKTPHAIIERLSEAVIAASRNAGIIEQLNKLGIEANGTTPEEFSAQIVREQPQFDLAIQAANLRQP